MATTSDAISRVAVSEQRSATSRRLSLSRIMLWIAVIGVTFFALFPFVFAIITSFKTQADSTDGTIIPWLQFQPTLINWQQELGLGGPETFKALANSALIASGATILAAILGTTAGYGLARFRYGIGNRNLVSWFLSQRFLPPIATVIPYVLLFRDLKLIDTQFGLILVNTTFVLPFAVLIMRDFFADFPSELQDAALVDGANHFQLFWRVALPLAGPALVATIIICFAFAWNEFLFASVLSTKNAKPYTMMVAGSDTVRGIMFNFVTTRLLLAITLPVVLSLLVQRYIVRGLTFGAVKG
jgi:multiple sugar transport system permease protein